MRSAMKWHVLGSWVVGPSLAVVAIAPLAGPRLLAGNIKPRATLQEHAGAIGSVAFSPDGKTLAAGSYGKTIKLWDVQTGKNTATLSDDTGHILSVAFSPAGKTVASGSG